MDDDLEALRRAPFALATAVTLVVAIAVFRLPEELIADLRAGRPFSAAQAGWVFRILALAAVGQAAYVGFAVLRPEKVDAACARDASLGAASPPEVVQSVVRNAALVPLLTLVYGASNIALTGERGNFWLFLMVAVAQLAWYFRATGEIAQWMSLQSRPPLEPAAEGAPEDRPPGGATDEDRAPPATT